MANQQTRPTNRSDQANRPMDKNQSNAPRKLNPGQSDELIQQEQGNTPRHTNTDKQTGKQQQTQKQKDSGCCGCG